MRLNEVFEAAFSGKECEWRFKGSKSPQWFGLDVKICEFDTASYEYRIKPFPTKRLIRADELPPVFWVRPESVERWSLVIEVDGEDLTTLTVTNDLKVYAAVGNIARIANANVPSAWSPDRKEVKSFYIEEESK